MHRVVWNVTSDWSYNYLLFILNRYAMHELGLSSRKPYKKCARVVGEVVFNLYCVRFSWYIDITSHNAFLSSLHLFSLPEFSFCFACFNCRCLVNSILMETLLCTIRWFEWHRYFSNLNDFIIDWIGSWPSKKQLFKILIIQKQIIIDLKKLLFVDFMNSVYYQYPWV